MILSYLKNRRTNKAFPKKVIGHWYTGSWREHLISLYEKGLYDGGPSKGNLDPNPSEVESPAEDKVAFNHFRTGHGRREDSGLIDGFIPAIRIGDRIGLYKQLGSKYGRSAFYDGLPWDDGYKIDLEFVKSVPYQPAA